MGALLKYNNMPFCGLRVTLSLTWSLSPNQLTSTGLPRGWGELGGQSSTSSGYVSFIDLILDWTNAGSLT